jgi:hypothetical protein
MDSWHTNHCYDKMDNFAAVELMEQGLLFTALLLGFQLLLKSIRNRSKLCRAALQQPRFSSWRHLYEHADDNSFLHITGFSREAFEALHNQLFPEGERLRPRRGRPRSLCTRDRVGLALMYLGSKTSEKILCLVFGIVPSVLSKEISTMMYLIVRRLKRNEMARVKFPHADEMAQLAAMVAAREPLVRNVIGFVDGLSLPVECAANEEAQRVDYTAYKHDTVCGNVFAFSPLGKVIYACINYPGSWHDSHIANGLIQYVLAHIGPYALCVDQGFPREGDLYQVFVGPYSRRRVERLAPELAQYLLPMANAYVSLRQASEWGMRALQGTFPRLKSRLTSDRSKRHAIITAAVLLHNFRTEFVGLNQIAQVFDPEYERLLNEEGYDRIEQYFFNV